MSQINKLFSFNQIASVFPNSGFSTGAKAGIIAGCAIGIVIFIFLVILYWRRHKRLALYLFVSILYLLNTRRKEHKKKAQMLGVRGNHAPPAEHNEAANKSNYAPPPDGYNNLLRSAEYSEAPNKVKYVPATRWLQQTIVLFRPNSRSTSPLGSRQDLLD